MRWTKLAKIGVAVVVISGDVALSPALDMAEGTVKGEPFHTQVVRIETTEAWVPSASQRLPQSRVM